MSGFFPVDREWRDNPIFRGDYSRGEAWLWLLENACWKPTKFDVKGRTVLLERGQLCASRDYLAKVWGWSSSAVERFLTRLQTEQMIGRETGQGKSVITISNYPKNSAELPEPGQETGQATGQRSDRDRTAKEQGNKGTREEEPNGSPSQGAGAPQGDEAGSNDLFGANADKPKAKRKREPKPQDQFVLPDWVPVDEWQAFLAMRDKIKATPTEHALRLLVKKLDELRTSGNDPGEVLEQSTMQNWRGIFEVRKSRNEQRNGNSNWGASSGNRGSRGEKCGFSTAIDDELERLGFGNAPGPSGRWDDDYSAADQGLRPARGRVLR